jgi:hypothetical protein
VRELTLGAGARVEPLRHRALGPACAVVLFAVQPSTLTAQTSNAHPSVSPDGTLIVVDSDRTGNGDIRDRPRWSVVLVYTVEACALRSGFPAGRLTR